MGLEQTVPAVNEVSWWLTAHSHVLRVAKGQAAEP